MAARLLVVDDDPVVLKMITSWLTDYSVQTASSGEQALELYAPEKFDAVISDVVLGGITGFDMVQRIRQKNPGARVLMISGTDPQARLITSLRENIIDFLVKPFGAEDLQAAVANVLSSEEAIEVISATPQWIELSVPASFQVVSRLGKFFEQLNAEIDERTREDISNAFRELLNNAIEHGCQGDASRRVTICHLRLGGVILYRINDPGCGFRMEELAHAAVANPPDDPMRHVYVRMERGMRGGGFGIMWARGIADELVYNEQGNEVVFARYIDDNLKSKGQNTKPPE